MNTSHAHRLGLLIFSCGLTLACSLEPVTVAKLTVTLSGLGEGTVAIVEIGAGHLSARVIHLGHTKDLRNPGAGLVFDGAEVSRVD